MRDYPINTEVLQKEFPGLYRDFFASSQEVASAPNVFFWTGELSGYFGGMTVSQKLPLRSYIGIEKTFDGQVVVERDYLAFVAEKKGFLAGVLDSHLCENLKLVLERHYAAGRGFTGMRVRLLSEVPLGHSLGANGAIAAALSILVKKDDTLEQQVVLAQEILSAIQSGQSSGASAYTSLAASNGPILFYKRADGYTAKPLEEFAGLSAPLSWPVDFGLIFTGIQSHGDGVILANNHTIDELDHAAQELDTVLGREQNLDFRGTYLNMLNMTAGLTVSTLVDIFKAGSQNHLLERFFNSLNQYHNLLYTLHDFNVPTNLLYGRIHTLANKQNNGVGSGVKISGLGRGGAVLFTMPYGNHRAGLLELVDTLRAESGYGMWLDYASWIDGVGGKPAQLEQDIAEGKYSSFVAHDSLVVTLVSQGTSFHQVVTTERFAEMVASTDLVVDLTTGKIFIAGNHMTSKELPSQKSTVIIISDLVKNKKFTLQSTELPSSYATNRYDLQGKIVIPLIREVKSLVQKDLQLSVHGEMYDNYHLDLDPSNISILVVEKKM